MHLVQSMHDGQNGIDDKGQLGIFVVRNSSKTFIVSSTESIVFHGSLDIVAIATGECAAEFLLPILAKPNVARVIVNVQLTKVLFEAGHA